MDIMGVINGVLQFAQGNEWAAILLALVGFIGAVDALLISALKVSNLLFPKVTWDDNIVNIVHGAIVKVLGFAGKLVKPK